jgi:hypothetical protein
MGGEIMGDSKDVSYISFEGACSRLERTNIRSFILNIILIAALVLSNVAWVVYELSFQDVQIEQEVQQDAEGNGSNVVGRDVYLPGGTDEE